VPFVHDPEPSRRRCCRRPERRWVGHRIHRMTPVQTRSFGPPRQVARSRTLCHRRAGDVRALVLGSVVPLRMDPDHVARHRPGRRPLLDSRSERCVTPVGAGGLNGMTIGASADGARSHGSHERWHQP
jgi:hypothetical protein